MNKKVKKRSTKYKNDKAEYHLGAVVILSLIGVFAYVYIGNVFMQVLQNQQVLGAASQSLK